MKTVPIRQTINDCDNWLQYLWERDQYRNVNKKQVLALFDTLMEVHTYCTELHLKGELYYCASLIKEIMSIRKNW